MIPKFVPHEVRFNENLLDAFFEKLETALGMLGARIMSSSIAENFYSKLGLDFYEHSNYTLQDYTWRKPRRCSYITGSLQWFAVFLSYPSSEFAQGFSSTDSFTFPDRMIFDRAVFDGSYHNRCEDRSGDYSPALER